MKLRIARMDKERLRKIVLVGEMTGGKRSAGRPTTLRQLSVVDYLEQFGICPGTWVKAADESPSEWHAGVEEGSREVHVRMTDDDFRKEQRALRARRCFPLALFPRKCDHVVAV